MTEPKDASRCLSPSDLQQLIRRQGEHGYELIDVREPEEFNAHHLKGARNIPVGEMGARLSELRDDVCTIFYCARGKRSALALSMAKMFKSPEKLFTLRGGIEAWDGNTLPSFPSMQPFDLNGTLEQVVLRGMDLEKGAERLYGALLDVFTMGPVIPLLQILYRAEKCHAKMLYDLLPPECATASRPFAEVYGEMEGNLLESGETFEQAMAPLQSMALEKRYLVLEFAAEMEYKAYDLYRNLATVYAGSHVETVLMDLAEQETRHFSLALKALVKALADARSFPMTH